MLCTNDVEIDRKTYILQSKLAGYKRAVEKSKDIIKSALDNSINPMMSFSGGKDSCVMLDLAVKCGFRGDLIFFRFSPKSKFATPDELVKMLKHCAKKYNLNYYILDLPGEFDYWSELGYFCISPQTPIEKKVYNAIIKSQSHIRENFTNEHKYDLNFIGMCKHESRVRKIMLSVKGNTYSVKSRKSLTCCPLSDMTDKYIWAYIFSNNLKYLSVYDFKYRNRRIIRSEPCFVSCEYITSHGALEEFKVMYPDYVNEIKERFPNSVV